MLRDLAAADQLRVARAASEAGKASSWSYVDLEPFVNGDHTIPPPTVLERTDGLALLYAGKVNAIYGESETGKSWIVLEACRQQLAAGAHVLYLDFEDTAQTLVGRLLALQTPPEAIVERVWYARPDENFEDAGRKRLDEMLTVHPTLCVVDGVTEAMHLLRLAPNDNEDAAAFNARLLRPLAETGAAVVSIDHVTKDRQTRSRYAIGAQHKLSAIDGAAYATETVKPFGRGLTGLVRITVNKDRPGFIRGACGGRAAGMAELASDGEHVTVTIGSDTSSGSSEDGGGFRPTHLMEQVSRLLEDGEQRSTNYIERGIRGKADVVRLALDVLVREGYIDRQIRGQAHLHTVLRAFRDDPSEAPE